MLESVGNTQSFGIMNKADNMYLNIKEREIILYSIVSKIILVLTTKKLGYHALVRCFLHAHRKDWNAQN